MYNRVVSDQALTGLTKWPPSKPRATWHAQPLQPHCLFSPCGTSHPRLFCNYPFALTHFSIKNTKTPPSATVLYAPIPRRQGGGLSPGPPLSALSGETAGGPPDAERGRQDFERQDCQSQHQTGTRLAFQSAHRAVCSLKLQGFTETPETGAHGGRGGGHRGRGTGQEGPPIGLHGSREPCRGTDKGSSQDPKYLPGPNLPCYTVLEEHACPKGLARRAAPRGHSEMD